MVDSRDKNVVGESSGVWRRWRCAVVDKGTSECGEQSGNVGWEHGVERGLSGSVVECGMWSVIGVGVWRRE